MKRFLAFTAAALLTAQMITAAEFTLSGMVYEQGGAAGGVSSPSGFAVFTAYRAGVAGQTGHQHNNAEDTDPVIPAWGEKIFRPDGAGIPAYYMSDIGSSDWSVTPITDGQSSRVVVEVWEPENGYSGTTFIGFAESVINSSEIFNQAKTMPDIVLAAVPSPVVTDYGPDFITVSWDCSALTQISGYSLYRKEEPSGAYVKISATSHVFGGSIDYTDSTGLTQGKDYTYMIKVNFPWGGGSAPDYFESYGGSRPSAFARLSEPTPTVTATLTPTETATLTPAETQTPHFTHTATTVQTQTVTPTMTVTPAMSPGLASIVEREVFVVISNPVRDRLLSAGINSEKDGIAELYIYNIAGMLADKMTISVKAGNNRIVTQLPDIASGVYVIKGAVRTAGYVRTLPARKIAVIR